MLRTATQKGRLILAVGSVVAAAAGTVALRADLMVGYGFSRALESQKPVRPFETAVRADVRQPAEVGDEIYWLTRSEFQLPVVSVGRVAVGDRITIAGRGGRVMHLEVSALRVPLLKTASGTAPDAQLEVTCRVLNATHHDGQEVVRFMIKVDEPKPPTLPDPEDPMGRT